ncbi:stage III sporulation protein AB [Xylanibacillus composti]|uniref:Stage III sporulation protein AB n=1 Tax=Xylanibacillus composti TaxID=1572762 RepID=A0A8J4H6P1_9BACL|nr:stage III sporulation protein SpoIIIAB [Xylanibacillus composti]MDT9726279.1 stage III sporulation protein AB [Xylanibacillus composti]GIQ70692.1 hypothetical protein XYCOK13_35160 [Xylanibacillus composti]
MQLIGALLVLIAGLWAGLHMASRYANRPKQLRQLRHALQRLETEIVYGYTPLSEAFARLAIHAAPPFASLFERMSASLRQSGSGSAADCWEREWSRAWEYTALRATDREVLLQLGRTLGVSDREDQMKHLHLAMRQLQAEEETAKEEQARYERMWRSLGLLGAALIVILMY